GRCPSSTRSRPTPRCARCAGPPCSGFRSRTWQRCRSAIRGCGSTSARSATRGPRSTPGCPSPPGMNRCWWCELVLRSMEMPVKLRLATAVLLVTGLGCAHSSLQSSDLEHVQRPALVSRLADDAGPQVNVYRADPARAGTLKAASPEAADQQLQQKLAGSVTRLEVGERLRSR